MARKKANPPGKKHPCYGCFHWRGEFYGSLCCNYLFDTGHRRPCAPGEGCSVRRERGEKEWEEIKKLKQL